MAAFTKNQDMCDITIDYIKVYDLNAPSFYMQCQKQNYMKLLNYLMQTKKTNVWIKYI